MGREGKTLLLHPCSKIAFKIIKPKEDPKSVHCLFTRIKETTLFRSLDLGGFIPIRDSGTVELKFVVSDNSRG